MQIQSYIIILTIFVIHYFWYYLTLPNTLGLVDENKKFTATKALTSYLIYMFLFICFGTFVSSYFPANYAIASKILST